MFIVLKVFNDGKLACFLGEEQGKFIAHYSLHRPYMRLAPGALVEGDLSRASGRYQRLDNVSLTYLGLARGHRQQFFLRFYLELAYLFLPQHQSAEESFFFLRASLESTALSWCDDRPSFGVVLSVFLLEILGFSPPANIATKVDIQHMLENWDSWLELEKEGGDLTLPQALVLKYDSLWGVSWMWISRCLSDHPQFKKIEKKWLGLLCEGSGAGYEKA